MHLKQLLWIVSFIAYISGLAGARAEMPDAPYRDKSPEELLAMATRYEHGEGTRRDIDEAIRLYCRAARQGLGEAAYRLGWIYANGRGGQRNDTVAASWFSLSAESGDAHAERMLDLVAASPAEENRRCLLSSGKEFQPALQSVPEPDRALVESWVERLAPDYKLHKDLVLAVIETESAFNVRAHSPKNARGLMQLIPATAVRFGVRDIWDPLDNLRGGMAYLRWLLDYFDGDLSLALAGYNAGEKAVDRYRGIPPYPETRAYVRQVLRRYDRSRA